MGARAPSEPVSEWGCWAQGWENGWLWGCCGEVLPLMGRWGWCWGSPGADGGDGPWWLTLPLPRLLHSLTNLKHVIMNAAHYLVLGDKDTYRHDPAAPFLGMVSSTSPWLPALWHVVPIPPGASPCCRGQEKGPSSLLLLPRMRHVPARTLSQRGQWSNWTPHLGRASCLALRTFGTVGSQ